LIVRHHDENVGSGVSMMGMNYFVLVSRDADNIAGLSTRLQFGIYKAIRLNKKVCFGYRKVFFPSLFKRVPVVSIRRRHAIHKLQSPYIANGWRQVVGDVVGFIIGVKCFVIFILDLVRYKLKIYDQVQEYPRLGYGGADIYDEDVIEGADGRGEISWSKRYEVNLQLSLPKRDQDKCLKYFGEMGLEKRQYVCLHIRTPRYKGTPSHDNTVFRNSTPGNCIDAIKFLAAKGVKIVRLGDPFEGIFPAMDGLVDYANSKYKSEEMDIYLIQNALFYWGTNSGIYDTAMLFSVPVFAMNVTDFYYAQPYKVTDLFLYKRPYAKDLGRVQTFKELFDEDLPPMLTRYEFIENSPEDIRLGVEEFFDNLAQKRYERTSEQEAFSRHLKAAVRRWVKNELTYDPGKYRRLDLAQKEVLAHLHYNGALGKSFASQYYGG